VGRRARDQIHRARRLTTPRTPAPRSSSGDGSPSVEITSVSLNCNDEWTQRLGGTLLPPGVWTKICEVPCCVLILGAIFPLADKGGRRASGKDAYWPYAWIGDELFFFL
jgi:hypothetical protein